MLKLGTKKQRNVLIAFSLFLVVFTLSFFSLRVIYKNTYSSDKDRSDLNEIALNSSKKVNTITPKAVIQKTNTPAPSSPPNTASSDSAQNIAIAPKKAYHSNPAEFSVIVNKKNPITPTEFIPPDLINYNGYLVSGKILTDLQSLLLASAENGTPLELSSAYRSYSNQIATYNHWVAINGGPAAADKISARPGYSEHQTGFAIDFSFGTCYLDCFNNSKQYIWLAKNASKYGFIERYPAGYESITGYSPESWHWRYVGQKTAMAMEMSGIKTLEELWGIVGGDY